MCVCVCVCVCVCTIILMCTYRSVLYVYGVYVCVYVGIVVLMGIS